MKKIIATIGLAIGLNFAATGIADASAVPETPRCREAKTALMNLQKKADAEKNLARKELLERMIVGATLAVKSQCR